MKCKHVPPCGPNEDCSSDLIPPTIQESVSTALKYCEHGKRITELCGLCGRAHAERAALFSAVNHPSHYGGDVTYEAIKVIEAWELTFNTGNAAKYICRAGKKDPSIAKHIEDLEKSREYLRFEIERLKRLKV